MNDAPRLVKDVERIDVKAKGFYVALDKNLKKIFVLLDRV